VSVLSRLGEHDERKEPSAELDAAALIMNIASVEPDLRILRRSWVKNAVNAAAA
jgi:hypothetical protein